MNTILILDKDAKTGLSEDLKERIISILKENAHRVEVVELGRNDVTPCCNLSNYSGPRIKK
jgi:uncharacterized protein YpmB